MNGLKKTAALLLAALLLMTAAACGKADKTESTPAASVPAAQTEADTKAPTAAPTVPAPSGTAAPATQAPATEPPATEPPATEPPATEPPATEPVETEAAAELPEAMDYALPENWAYFEADKDKAVDVFLICPTVDTKSDTNAFDLNEKLKGRFISALDMEKGIYEETGRMFSPYYRQMSIKAYTLPADQYEAAKEIACRDISDAFRWYLDNVNEGRGLILAGFSQGAELCLELLKEYYGDGPEAAALREKLITVYAIGWTVTKEMTEAYPQIVPAAGESDIGTVVSFDCEDGSLTETIIIPAGVTALSINPLNWKTDGTPADKTLNLGAVMETGAEPVPALCGAVLGERGELIVADVSPADYPPVLDIFPEGAYHLYDYMFFFTNLKQNIALRTQVWQEAHP